MCSEEEWQVSRDKELCLIIQTQPTLKLPKHAGKIWCQPSIKLSNAVSRSSSQCLAVLLCYRLTLMKITLDPNGQYQHPGNSVPNSMSAAVCTASRYPTRSRANKKYTDSVVLLVDNRKGTILLPHVQQAHGQTNSQVHRGRCQANYTVNLALAIAYTRQH